MIPRDPATPIDSQDPILSSVERDLVSLQKRQEQRRVADTKRSWAPTVLGGVAGIIGGGAVLLHEKYHRLVDVVRSLRHAEVTAGGLDELKNVATGGELSATGKIYKLLADKNAKVAEMAGVTQLDPERSINALFDRYGSPAYLATNERLGEAFKKLHNGQSTRPYRKLLEEEVMDKLDSNNIVSFRWRHLAQADKVRIIAIASVSAVAIGAVVYGVAHLLTNESKEDKKSREQDNAMAEDARKYGFAPLTPSAQTKDAADFRERLHQTRLALTNAAPEL